MAVEIGQVLDGKYRIVRLIGKGGMGAVYEAKHLLIERRVAVKELHADAAAADHAITRFEREARAAGRIGSDHILQILDVGLLSDGSRYMVSEYLDGETLDSRIRRVGRLTPAELLPIARQLLTGLGAAHQALVLHRDLKPDNIFLVRQKSGTADFVKLIDFGIAKFQPGINPEDGLKMTKTGMVVGTPYYLSPEQARGTGEADARSDLYAVGVILYECLTGNVPFSALNFNDLIFKIVLETPLPPAERTAGIDQRLSDLVLRAMARDPAARFQSAQAMMTALSEWANSAAGASALSGFGTRPAAPGEMAPPGAQTLASADHPFALSPSGGAGPSDVAFRTLASPTPASFGATRDPRSSTHKLPLRSQVPLVLLSLVAAALLLLAVGFAAFRHVQGKEPATATSVAVPVASSAQAGVLEVAPAPEIVTPSDIDAPSPESESEREAPIAHPRKFSLTPRTQSPTRPAPGSGAPENHVAAAAPVAPTAAPAARTAAPAAPAKRADWGY